VIVVIFSSYRSELSDYFVVGIALMIRLKDFSDFAGFFRQAASFILFIRSNASCFPSSSTMTLATFLACGFDRGICILLYDLILVPGAYHQLVGPAGPWLSTKRRHDLIWTIGMIDATNIICCLSLEENGFFFGSFQQRCSTVMTSEDRFFGEIPPRGF
jgi:hypothetical protein